MFEGLKVSTIHVSVIQPAARIAPKFLNASLQLRGQSLLVAELYAWAAYVAFDQETRRKSADKRQKFIGQAIDTAVTTHCREQNAAYVAKLGAGESLLQLRLNLRESFSFLFLFMLERLWFVDALHSDARPYIFRAAFEKWLSNRQYILEGVDVEALTSDLDELTVGCCWAAANVHSGVTGRQLTRAAIPESVAQLPKYVDVFISYAREDRHAADQLEAALIQRGYHPWFDKHILSERRFDDAINTNLQDARKVVVLWSRESTNSQWVRGEALHALNHGKLLNVSLDLSPLTVPFNTIQLIPTEVSSTGQIDFSQLLAIVDTELNGPGRA